MLIKLGVSIERLNRPVRRALKIIEDVFKNHGEKEAVITSTYEGNHSASSLHYCNNAVDIRLPMQAHKIKDILDNLKEELGTDFDVILEATHYHVEYDIDS